MARTPEGDRPLTDAERQARRRARLVTFTPADKPALVAAAEAAGQAVAPLVAQVVDAWIKGSRPTPAPARAEQIAAAAMVEEGRRAMLERFIAVLNRADTPEALQRIALRVAILEDVTK